MVRNDRLEYSNQNITALDVFNINFQNRTSQSDEKYAILEISDPLVETYKVRKYFYWHMVILWVLLYHIM